MTYLSSVSVKSENSSANSTTTLLNAGNTFTGTFEQNAYTDVMVSLKTDQEGTLYMDFSPDGSNVDSTISFKYNPDRINPPHILVKGNRYYRTRFTNDSASNQTYLRLVTDYGHFQKLTAAINGTLAESYDAIVTRPTDFHYEVAISKRQGHTTWNKFGYNNDVDTGGAEHVWSFGGTHTILTSAETLDVVSTSTNDTNSSGTGARSVRVYGIDANYEALTEDVNLNGTTTVTTSGSFLGVNRAVVLTCGSGGVNAGDINITATTATTNQAQIPTGQGTTQQLIFFTQANHTALADYLLVNVNKISGGGSPVVTIKGWSYAYVTGCKYEVFRYTIDTAVENTVEIRPSQPFVIAEKQVLYFTAETTADNSVVNMRMSLIECRNT